MKIECVFCGKKIPVEGKISRRDVCLHCGRDLRCCKQCKFFDQHAYNECKEVMAERISDKERSNFCDYFVPKGSKEISGVISRTREAKEALEALFRK